MIASLVKRAPFGLAIVALAACTGASDAATPETASERIAESADASPASTQSRAPVDALGIEAPDAGLHHPDCPTSFILTGEFTQGGYVRGTAPCNAQVVFLGDQRITPDDDGRFFAAFDRDNESEVILTGGNVRQTLTISPREWNISHVNVARRPGGASEAFMRRRQPELDAIWDARQRETGATGWQQDFIWPVKGRISGHFGRQRIYRGEPGGYHSGIDIAPGNGVAFVAPADGVVVLARTGFSLEGGLIIIDHGAGLNSAFLHASRIAVEEGQEVRQGEHIGNVGSTGRATGPHLHWSLKWNLARLDPLLFVGPMN